MKGAEAHTVSGAGSDPGSPSPCTLFRWRLQTLQRGEEGPDPTAGLPAPIRALWNYRLKGARERIQAAAGPADLVLVADEAAPPADLDWHVRLRQAGPSALPELMRAVEGWPGAPSPARAIGLQNLVAAFLWTGEAGAAALTATLPRLSPDAGGLAAVVLGLMAAKGSADALYAFHEDQRWRPEHRHFVGALWGLADLRDRRAPAAVGAWLESGRRFFELYGLASLCPDARLIVPLLRVVTAAADRNERTDALMALAATAQRLGPAAFKGLLHAEFGDSEAAEAGELAELVCGISAARVAGYFQAFWS